MPINIKNSFFRQILQQEMCYIRIRIMENNNIRLKFDYNFFELFPIPQRNRLRKSTTLTMATRHFNIINKVNLAAWFVIEAQHLLFRTSF